MLTAQGIISLLTFVIHDLINEHNGERRRYSLGRTTLKNSLCIYLPLWSLQLTTLYKSPEKYTLSFVLAPSNNTPKLVLCVAWKDRIALNEILTQIYNKDICVAKHLKTQNKI